MSHEIQRLIEGNKQFRNKFFSEQNTLFDELVSQGQRPKIVIVACCDSRVDPAVIFNCQPGDLFIIRNIANLIPPCENNDASYHGTSAALEFGTCFLEVDHIIILGHTQCGGIRALLESATAVKQPHSFIAKWMELARPAYDQVITHHANVSLEQKIVLCEQYALVNSLHNLHTFPWIKQRIATGKVSAHAWYFDLHTGGIHRYDQEMKTWDS